MDIVLSVKKTRKNQLHTVDSILSPDSNRPVLIFTYFNATISNSYESVFFFSIFSFFLLSRTVVVRISNALHDFYVCIVHLAVG